MPEFSIEWIKILLTGSILLSLLGGAELLKKYSRSKPEGTRKFAHLTTGGVVSVFPFVFDHLASVLLISVVFFIIVVLSWYKKFLGALHNVERTSTGAFLFPIVVGLIFYLSNGQWLYYLVPMLLITIPDAVAALVGSEYGRLTYPVHKQVRTLEGSLVFFLTSFNIILIPVLLSGTVNNETAILVAVLLALLITGIEAVSVAGIDNLFVPVVSFIGLSNLLIQSEKQLLLYIVVLLGSFLGMLSLNRWKQFTLSGIIGLSLMLFAIYAWGGYDWLIPAVFYFLTFNLGLRITGFTRRSFRFLPAEETKGLYEISAVFHLSALPLLVLVLNNYTAAHWHFSVFIGLVGAATSIAYYHFLPYLLRKNPVSMLPPKSWRFRIFQVSFSLSGGMVIYFLGHTFGNAPLHSWYVQLISSIVALAVLLILHRYLIAHYYCPQCGRQVFVPQHCRSVTHHISGIRFIGLWQGVLLTMMVVAGFMLIVEFQT